MHLLFINKDNSSIPMFKSNKLIKKIKSCSQTKNPVKHINDNMILTEQQKHWTATKTNTHT